MQIACSSVAHAHAKKKNPVAEDQTQKLILSTDQPLNFYHSGRPKWVLSSVHENFDV